MRGSVQGRAPVVSDQNHIACPDRGGMNICLYANDNAKFPLKGKLEVHITKEDAWHFYSNLLLLALCCVEMMKHTTCKRYSELLMSYKTQTCIPFAEWT